MGQNGILQCNAALFSISFQECYALKVSMALAGMILRQRTRFRRTVSDENPEKQNLEPLTILFTPKQYLPISSCSLIDFNAVKRQPLHFQHQKSTIKLDIQEQYLEMSFYRDQHACQTISYISISFTFFALMPSKIHK